MPSLYSVRQGRGRTLCLRHLPPPSRGERGFGRRLHPRSGGRGDPGGVFTRGAGGERIWVVRRIPGWTVRRRRASVRRAGLAGLGASPSVAARQLPLGGSDWIGLFGRGLQAGGLRLADWRWLPRSVAAPLCHSVTSPPAPRGERGSGRPISGFGRPLLVADRGESGAGRPISGFGRPLLVADRGESGAGRPIPGFGRPLLVADRGERGAGRPILRIRSATPCGRPGREGSRSADPRIRSATPCGRPGREGSRSADPRIRSATPCGRPGGT